MKHDLALTRPDPSGWLRARSLPSAVVLLGGLALSLFALGVSAVMWSPAGSPTAAFWPAAGLSCTAASLTRGRSRWAVLAVVGGSTWAANVEGGRPGLVSVCFAAANVLEAAIVAGLLTRDQRPRLDDLADLGRLLAAAACGAVTIGVLAALTVSVLQGAPFGPTLSGVAAAHAAAILVCLPLAAPNSVTGTPRWERLLQWFAALAVVSLVFAPQQSLPLAFLPFPVLVWAGLRQSLRAATWQLLAVGVVTVLLTSESGGFSTARSDVDPQESGLLVQLFLLAAVLVVLSLSVTLSQRQRALAELQQSRQHLADLQQFDAAVLEVVDVAVLACDATGTVVLRNAVQRRLTGVDGALHDSDLDPDEIASRLHVELEDGSVLPASQSPLRQAMAGRELRALPATITRDGQVRHVLLTAQQVHDKDGRLLGAVAAATDVSPQREVQQQLLDSVRELQARERELRRGHEDLAALAAASSSVLSGTHARAAICQAAKDISGSLSVMLLEPDEKRRVLVNTYTAGPSLPALTIPLDSSSRSVACLTSGRVQLVSDVRHDPRTDPQTLAAYDELLGGPLLQASLHIPVLRAGKARAVLTLALPEPVSAGDLRLLGLLELLATDAALALSREDLTHELERLSVTDPLTGVANRRRWDEELAREITVAHRRAHPLTLVMLDLDHFKAFNDAFGHPEGDALLQETTRSWQAQLRGGDLLARVGGEEFAILLRDCSLSDAEPTVERLLRSVPRGRTCSAGVAQLAAAEGAQQLLARADAALYDAKSGGRDRAVLASALVDVLVPEPRRRARPA